MTAAALPLRRATTPWARHLVALAAVAAGILMLWAHDAAHLVAIWWESSTYAHCLLIAPILAWLVAERLPALRHVAPHAWPAASLVPAAGAVALLLGEAGGVATLRHLGLVLMLAGAVPVLLGKAAAKLLAFPLGFSLFLVPVGEELVPALQLVTARMCMALLSLLGIPAHLEGVFITVPYGWFEVAEACSGVKFLVAMAALAVLVAHLCFRSWPRRIAFVLFALAVPVLANGLRAFGTIWVARTAGVEAATGLDHLIYGWIFFAAVIALTLGAAAPFFDRSPSDRPKVLPQAAPRPSGSALPLAGSLLLLAALPLFWLEQAHALTSISTLAKADVPGWTRVAGESVPHWRPRFTAADGFTRARYRDHTGAEIDVILASYGWQAEGHELVAFGQGTDPAWSRSGQGGAVAHGRADRFTSPRAGREVLTFYRVNELRTGEPALVKWTTLRARLLRRPSGGSVLLVSSASPGPPAASRPVIDRFLRAAGGVDALLPR